MPLRLGTASATFSADFERLLARRQESAEGVDDAVASILSEVRAHGDAALIEFSRRFDRVDLTPASLRIATTDLSSAQRACVPDAIAALRFAAMRIEKFHRRQLPNSFDYHDEQGVRLGLRWTPVASVGLYVPGGTAAYPSSVLMNAIPAKVAGV